MSHSNKNDDNVNENTSLLNNSSRSYHSIPNEQYNRIDLEAELNDFESNLNNDLVEVPLNAEDIPATAAASTPKHQTLEREFKISKKLIYLLIILTLILTLSYFIFLYCLNSGAQYFINNTNIKLNKLKLGDIGEDYLELKAKVDILTPLNSKKAPKWSHWLEEFELIGSLENGELVYNQDKIGTFNQIPIEFHPFDKFNLSTTIASKVDIIENGAMESFTRDLMQKDKLDLVLKSELSAGLLPMMPNFLNPKIRGVKVIQTLTINGLKGLKGLTQVKKYNLKDEKSHSIKVGGRIEVLPIDQVEIKLKGEFGAQLIYNSTNLGFVKFNDLELSNNSSALDFNGFLKCGFNSGENDVVENNTRDSHVKSGCSKLELESVSSMISKFITNQAPKVSTKLVLFPPELPNWFTKSLTALSIELPLPKFDQPLIDSVSPISTKFVLPKNSNPRTDEDWKFDLDTSISSKISVPFGLGVKPLKIRAKLRILDEFGFHVGDAQSDWSKVEYEQNPKNNSLMIVNSTLSQVPIVVKKYMQFPFELLVDRVLTEPIIKLQVIGAADLESITNLSEYPIKISNVPIDESISFSGVNQFKDFNINVTDVQLINTDPNTVEFTSVFELTNEAEEGTQSIGAGFPNEEFQFNIGYGGNYIGSLKLRDLDLPSVKGNKSQMKIDGKIKLPQNSTLGEDVFSDLISGATVALDAEGNSNTTNLPFLHRPLQNFKLKSFPFPAFQPNLVKYIHTNWRVTLGQVEVSLFNPFAIPVSVLDIDANCTYLDPELRRVRLATLSYHPPNPPIKIPPGQASSHWLPIPWYDITLSNPLLVGQLPKFIDIQGRVRIGLEGGFTTWLNYKQKEVKGYWFTNPNTKAFEA
jgi:hypothetical protein